MVYRLSLGGVFVTACKNGEVTGDAEGPVKGSEFPPKKLVFLRRTDADIDVHMQQGRHMSEIQIYFAAMAAMGGVLAIIQQVFDKSFQRKMSTALAFSLSVIFVSLFQILPVLYFRSAMNTEGNAEAATGAVIAIFCFSLLWILLEKAMPGAEPERTVSTDSAAQEYARIIENRGYRNEFS